MNCCDDFGNCRQGRDCAARMQDGWKLADEDEGMSAVEMLTTVVIYLVFVLVVAFSLGIVVGLIK